MIFERSRFGSDRAGPNRGQAGLSDRLPMWRHVFCSEGRAVSDLVFSSETQDRSGSTIPSRLRGGSEWIRD
ncbi:MAG: hypothetical protein C4334_03315 [Pyrinomonas sp.]